jgi:hypothetical protein
MQKQKREVLRVTKQGDDKQYGESEMDELVAPPFRMFSVFLIITASGFLYSLMWAFLLKP